MPLEVIGALIKTLPEVTGQGKNGTWVKREFVLETQDQYPKKIAMSVWGDKVQDLASYAIGSTIKASISLESREYNERWYTEVRAFRLELIEEKAEGSSFSAETSKEPKPFSSLSPDSPTSPEEDLPF